MPSSSSDQASLAAQKSSKKNKPKFVPLLDKNKIVLLPGRHICDCEGSIHDLLINCLNCGRIICAQEGLGKCFTCRKEVKPRGYYEELIRQYEETALEAQTIASNHQAQGSPEGNSRKKDNKPSVSLRDIAASLGEAVAHKNKLLDYDENSERRTKVLDDETDYFRLESEHWLNSKVRGVLASKVAHLHENKFAKERKIFIDIDNRSVGELQIPKIDDIKQVVENLKQEADFKSDYDFVDSKLVKLDEPLPAVQYVPGKSQQPKPSKSSPESPALKRSVFSRIQDDSLISHDQGTCLSIQQPYASLVIAGIKLHEARTWYTPFRGTLWIQAPKKLASDDEITAAKNVFSCISNKPFPKEFPTSILLGCVQLDDCLTEETYHEKYGEEAYIQSPYVLIFSEPRMLPCKIPMIANSNRLFQLNKEVFKAASQQLKSSSNKL